MHSLTQLVAEELAVPVQAGVCDFAAQIAAQYRKAQEQRMAYTADQSDPRPASERGAEALRQYIERLAS